jgi:hypothetical protein
MPRVKSAVIQAIYDIIGAGYSSVSNDYDVIQEDAEPGATYTREDLREAIEIIYKKLNYRG